MAIEFFGITFGKKSAPNVVQNLPSPVSPQSEDGSTLVYNASSYFGVSYLDIDGSVNNDSELIKRYRTISGYSVIDIGIENIVNEAIVYQDGAYPVKLNLDNLPISRNLKMKILQEFANILQLFKFDKEAYQHFRKWYIDGRIFFAIITDEKNPQNGILELRPIDPRRIKKIKQVNKENQNGVDIVTSVEEYYIYSDTAFTQSAGSTITNKSASQQGVKFNKDAIICVNSGQIDYNTGQVIGYLHKAIRPANQLRMLEDAVVIYKLTRAPERRIFYIDVGNLPKLKAEEYMNDIMQRYRNKVVYDGTTGEVKDDRKFASMLEDYWMPRRGDKGTEISTIQGANPGFTDMVDVDYFKRELYRALNVPFSRLQSETGFNIGRASEISRDEVNFQKFIERLQKKFAELFLTALETQLVLKRVLAVGEFDQLKNYIFVQYNKDNYFEELKESEILLSRLEAANDIQPFVGKYFSHTWVRKNILKQNDEQLEMMDAEIEQEFENPLYYPPVPDADAMMAGMGGAEDAGGSSSGGSSSGGSNVMTMADVQHTMSKTIDQVAAGASIMIKRGGKTVAKLLPANANEENIVDTILSKNINNIQYLIETLQENQMVKIDGLQNSIYLQRI